MIFPKATQAETHRMWKVRQSSSGGETETHEQQGDDIWKLQADRLEMFCIGIEAPKKQPVSTIKA